MSRRQRVLTAAVMAPLPILAVLFLPTPWLAAFVAAALLAGLWEWTRLAGLEDAPGRAAILTAHALVIAALAWLAGSSPVRPMVPLQLGAMAGVLFWLLVPLWLARPDFARADHAGARALKLLAGSLLVIPTWCAVGWLHHGDPADPFGPRWTLYAMALVWVADSGAYFAGSKFGRRKLAPAISPGKSWEGVAGGLVATALFAAAARPLLGLDWAQLPALVALTLVVAMASVVGDLFESLMKRHAGLKDSGSLLPGHGGLMDRLDSLLAALPVFAVGKALAGL